jgi:phosphoserine phosphatase RsbU/P
MRILVAEDDAVTRRLLEATLGKFGWEVITAEDGEVAWRILTSFKGKDLPELVLLDWMMPQLEGPALCRRLRETPGFELTYVILLTSKTEKEDLSTGLASGANDYIVKPFHPVELEARVRVGERMIKLQTNLAARVKELEDALADVKRLQGLLPICAYCKKVRNETDYWQQVDSYLAAHTDVTLTHGVCPDCYDRVMKEIEVE